MALAVDEWSDRPDPDDRPATDRSALRGALILLAVSFLAIGALWVTAAELGWRPDRALWVGVGLSPIGHPRGWGRPCAGAGQASRLATWSFQ